jgi:hypothetical protein
VYPTVVDSGTRLSIQSDELGLILVSITNLSDGRSFEYHFNHTNSQTEHAIDMHDYSSGIWIIKTTLNDSVNTLKVVKR